MKTTSSRFTRGLRGAAAAVLLAGIGVWAFGGAHIGWTQTSTVSIQRDDITGIDYPVRQAGFVPGVEVPLLATAVAAALAGLSFFARRPQAVAVSSRQ
jgi:hypothetical protein